MKNTSCWLVTATCLALPVAAGAQPDPADPGTAAAALRYESAFSDYRPWQETPPGDWRAINDALRKEPVDHAGHGAAPAPGAPAAPAATPAPPRQAPVPGQGAHPMHGGEE